ncbi:BPTI/Kunitz domain-containing protein [Spirosoma daeguense]
MKQTKIRKALLGICIATVTIPGCQKDCATSERCQLQPNAGPCYAAFTKYYYDQSEKRCKTFTYGGCGGVIPFDTMEQCKECECRK